MATNHTRLNNSIRRRMMDAEAGREQKRRDAALTAAANDAKDDAERERHRLSKKYFCTACRVRR